MPVVNDAVWLTERDVVDLLDLPAAVDALEAALREQATGAAATMVKTHATWGDHATLHAVGGVFPAAGLVGAKCWAHTPGGAAPLLLLFDADDGRSVAVVEAFALGQLRTAAISAVATDRMAEKGVADMAIAGAGKQALGQVAAVRAVRPIERVRVWSRSIHNANGFAARLAAAFPLAVTVHESVAELVEDVPVITLATRATTPFLAANSVAKGAHVNAVGAITPERAEFEPGLLGRAGVVAVDNVPQAKALASEFRAFYGEDDTAWSRVRALSEVVASGDGRPRDADITIFKAMGIGLADVAIGARLLVAAQAAGRGRGIPPTERIDPFRQAPREGGRKS